MPHKCVRCSRLYEAGALALKEGCECGSKVFLFLKQEGDEEKIGDVKWIEKELAHIVNKADAPITLEVENVNIADRGVFELDINSLAINPVVVKDVDGIYYIRLGRFGRGDPLGNEKNGRGHKKKAK